VVVTAAIAIPVVAVVVTATLTAIDAWFIVIAGISEWGRMRAS
jgi:hypothetical protein